MPLSAELRVANFARSLRFYTDILGFFVLDMDAVSRRAELARDDTILTLIEHETGPSGLEYPYGRGVVLMLWVPDVETLLATAEAYGVRIMVPPEIREHAELAERRTHIALELADPDGYALRFCQRLGEGISPYLHP